MNARCWHRLLVTACVLSCAGTFLQWADATRLPMGMPNFTRDAYAAMDLSGWPVARVPFLASVCAAFFSMAEQRRFFIRPGLAALLAFEATLVGAWQATEMSLFLAHSDAHILLGAWASLGLWLLLPWLAWQAMVRPFGAPRSAEVVGS